MGLLQPGQSFGVYRMESVVSRGGMGEVWRARKLGAESWSKTVALKVIAPMFADEERFAAMFLTEAKLAAALDHVNIVPVVTFGRENGLLFIEMEYVVGRDLRGVLEKHGRGLPLPLALFVTAETLKGLAYAHERRDESGKPLRIVHRDIKPHNLLLSFEGAVKLADFGIAKATAEHTASSSAVKGTAGYLAPELLDGAPASQQSDLFGLGLVMWECITGRKLFDGETEAERIKRTFECRVPALAEVGVDVSPAVEKILCRLLARDPTARYATASEALSAVLAVPESRQATSVDLKAFLSQLLPDASRPTPAAPAPLPRTRPSAPAQGTGTLAGESAVAEPPPSTATRFERLLGSRLTLAILGVLAAASVAAAAIVWTRPNRPAREARPAAPMSGPAVAESRPQIPALDASPAQAPAAARLIIDVVPPDARITVDGRELAGESPFAVEGLALGVTMRVHAERDGYVPVDSTILVDQPAVTVPVRLARKEPSAGKPPSATKPPATNPPDPPKPTTGSKPPTDGDGTILPEHP